MTCPTALMSLPEKYRPRTLSEIIGQPWIVSQLREFVERPFPCALIFDGGTGCGKTSTALALAAELGIKVERAEFSGLWQIASGEQTGETVREMMKGLRVSPWEGSGWKVLIVNEADIMTPGAAGVWLDALENLPPRTVVIFTTNYAKKLPQRLRDRCECFSFESGSLFLTPALQELVNKVWVAERQQGPAPDVTELGDLTDEQGNASFRRVLQRLAPHLRKTAPKPPVAAPQVSACAAHGKTLNPTIPAANLDQYGRRWKTGEKITTLAREAGYSWNRLHSELTKLGYQAAA